MLQVSRKFQHLYNGGVIWHYIFIPNTLIPNALILTTLISQIQPSRITFYFPWSFLPSPLSLGQGIHPSGVGIHRDNGIRETDMVRLMKVGKHVLGIKTLIILSVSYENKICVNQLPYDLFLDFLSHSSTSEDKLRKSHLSWPSLFNHVCLLGSIS